MSSINGTRAQSQAQREGTPVNVAILGAGRIAHTMATTLSAMAQDPRYSNLIRPYAVASREQTRAEEFAAQHNIPHAYGSYEALLDDPKVDLVYVATPVALHEEQGIQCLRAGKNVLMEKSFTANAEQAERLLACAKETGLLCTEAIWTRYMPSRAIISDIIASEAIGTVQAANANLCYPVSHKPRMTDPQLAGGALLDVGVYPLNFLDMAIGGNADHNRHINHIETSMQPWPTGVDAQENITLHYDDGVMATAQASMLAASDRTGTIWGTDGYLVCHNINNPEGIDVYGTDHTLRKHYDVPEQINGYEYEVASAANTILDGRDECPEMPHKDTLRIMQLMDCIRGIWGLQYPFEQ